MVKARNGRRNLFTFLFFTLKTHLRKNFDNTSNQTMTKLYFELKNKTCVRMKFHYGH